MRPFRLSTVVTLRIGPCLDSTGAEYTSLVIGDLTLTKAGTSAAMAAAATLTHIANGHYSLVTIAGNTDTLGSLRIDCNKSTYQIPPVEGEVLPATVFDALVTNAAGGANGLLLSLASNQVDVGKFLGSATPVTNLNTIFNTDYATIYDATNKAFLSKLGNFAMGGSSLALTTGAISGTTLTLSGAVALQSTLTVSGATSLAALSTSGTTTLNALTVSNALIVSGATTLTGAVTATNASNDIRGIAITSNVKKNQALSSFQFLMTDSTNHAPATGKTVTVTRQIDNGSFGAGSLSSVTEIANGMYRVDFAAADLNGNTIILRATASSCDDTFERIVTQP